METRGSAHRVECSRTGSRRRNESGCRRAWWPSARREDVRRPCRARSRPCTTCHARGRHRDPAADSPKGKPTRVEHVQAIRLEAAAAPQARPEAGKCASALVHPWPRAVLHARSTSASPACHAGGSRISLPRGAQRHQKGRRSACVRGGWAEGVRSPLRRPPPDRRRRGCQKIRRGAAKKNRPGPTSR